MTITVPGMRSNKLVSMDIDQLRGWATFMDRAMIVSLVATIVAVTALGVTTWLSFRFSGAVRFHEHAAVDRYKEAEGRFMQLEQDVTAARERAATLEREVSTAQGRAATLEREVSTAQGRTAALEQEVAAARERAVALEQEASRARERAAAFEQAAREATERSAQAAARESTATSERVPSPQLNPAAIQQRLADLAKLVRDATARAAAPVQGRAAETQPKVQAEGAPESSKASRDQQRSPIVESLRKYAGTNAAVFVLDRVPEAPAAASTISTYLGDAGWPSHTWTWTGVAGILGVVVLTKEGSDATTQDAASALVEALRTAGFNAAKGDWPADWRRYRGALDGPQTPGPTDAPIRVVVGAKAASTPR
ncbi:MAG: hypothetical protein AB7F22_35075 [Reyranella sp.]|uniref:hypothetical protein n=1 Tax=Reyranella sp. TaxID=1929291 RepID=UPI003D0E0149